jgi:acetoacetate decarboxylase
MSSIKIKNVISSHIHTMVVTTDRQTIRKLVPQPISIHVLFLLHGLVVLTSALIFGKFGNSLKVPILTYKLISGFV